MIIEKVVTNNYGNESSKSVVVLDYDDIVTLGQAFYALSKHEELSERTKKLRFQFECIWDILKHGTVQTESIVHSHFIFSDTKNKTAEVILHKDGRKTCGYCGNILRYAERPGSTLHKIDNSEDEICHNCDCKLIGEHKVIKKIPKKNLYIYDDVLNKKDVPYLVSYMLERDYTEQELVEIMGYKDIPSFRKARKGKMSNYSDKLIKHIRENFAIWRRDEEDLFGDK